MVSVLLAWVSLYPRLRIDSDQSFGSCPERKHQRIHRTVPVHRNQGRTNHFRIPRNYLLLKINIDAGKNKKYLLCHGSYTVGVFEQMLPISVTYIFIIS